MVLLNAFGNAAAELPGHPDEIHRHDDLTCSGLIFENEGFRVEILPLAFGGFVTSSVTRHPDEFLRGHDDRGDARLPLDGDVRRDRDRGRLVTLGVGDQETEKDGGNEESEAAHW